MNERVVGVHGIGNLQQAKSPSAAASILGNRWTAALRRGLGQGSEVEAVVAYYAYELATDTAQGPGEPDSLSQAEQELLLRWAAELGAPAEVAQGRLTAPARAAADWIARHFGLDDAAVRMLVTVFCREVQLYLASPARRDAARRIVADTISSSRPRVVLAHSLGSVVAYETLWEHRDLEVELLITLGSPLALPDVIFAKLNPPPAHGKGQRPPGVQRWINIADPGDFIAIPHGLHRYFDGIDTDLTTPIGVFNFHKVTGYLSCATTAAALAAVLGR